jgi:hypothetical protein
MTQEKNLVAQDGAVKKIVTVASGDNLAAGAVVERSSQKVTELSTAANARAVMAEAVDASGGDTQGYAFVLGHLHYDDLVWPSMSAANKKSALEALEDAGISVDIDHTDVEATA